MTTQPEPRSVTEALRALWAEPHHLGFPVSGKTGTYDADTVMVKRDWYDRLAALAPPTPDPAPAVVPDVEDGAAFTEADVEYWRGQLVERHVDPDLEWRDADVLGLVARWVATVAAIRAEGRGALDVERTRVTTTDRERFVDRDR